MVTVSCKCATFSSINQGYPRYVNSIAALCNLIKRISVNVIPAKLVLDQIGEHESIKRPKTGLPLSRERRIFLNRRCLGAFGAFNFQSPCQRRNLSKSPYAQSALGTRFFSSGCSARALYKPFL